MDPEGAKHTGFLWLAVENIANNRKLQPMQSSGFIALDRWEKKTKRGTTQ